MLFLFENTLTHYIYIVFYTLISRAPPAHNLGNFSAVSRHATPTATPSPRSDQLRTHGQPRHRTTSVRTTSTASGRPMGAPSSPAGTPLAVNRAPIVPAGYPRPPGCAPEYTYKFCLTFTIPKGCSAAVALFCSRFVQNLNLL